jgi:hypothetical protein
VAGFPDSDLEVTTDFAFGADATTPPSSWTWTDLSARLVGNPITIQRGLLVGQGNHRSASTTLTLLNDDGALTPLLATSPYWPYVDVGTPGRVRLRSNTVPWIADTFGRTSGSSWGAADSGQSWAAGSGLSTNGSAGLFTSTSTNLIRSTQITATHRDAKVMWDAGLSVVSTGASHVFGCTLRDDGTGNNYIWAGMEYGLAGIVQWTIRTVQAGNVVVEQQVTQPGLTYTAGQAVRCEVELIGDTLQARAWLVAGTKPPTWACSVQLSQMVGVKGTVAGMRGWCVNGNTNTLPTVITVDNLTFSQPRYPRIEGYLTDVRPTFQPLSDGTVHSVVQIDIGGIVSRLEKKDAPELSPLRRSLEKAPVPPKIYWPCEDGQGALQAASAFPGGNPMIVNGPAVFSFDTGETDDAYLRTYGTQNLCSIAAGASLLGLISPAVGSSAWTVSAMLQAYAGGVGGGVTEIRLLEWATPGGTYTRWAFVQTNTGYQVRAYNDVAGTVTTVITDNIGEVVLLAGYDVTVAQAGGNLTVTYYINANPQATATVAGTIAAVARVTANPDKVNTTASTDPHGIRLIAGHIMVHDTAAASALPYYYDGAQVLRADRGWGYEYAHRRFGRQCTEERVSCKVLGNPYVSGTTQLNIQQPGSFTDLVTASIEAESGGLIVEDGFGYTHIPRSWRYNRGVDLTVDMSVYRRSDGTDAVDVLVPKLDARGPNYWTIQRTSGSEATAAAPLAFRNRRGTITQSATLDVLYDADCAQHAGWRVHVYTDGAQANYPSLTLDLAANPGLVDDYLNLSIASRVQRTNQPTIAGLGVIDQVVDQMAETFAPRTADGGPSWTASLDTSPATVWQVGVFDTQLWDSSSTTLAADVASGNTVLGFSTALEGDVWSTTDSPIAVTVSGQATTVLWMSGIGSVAAIEGGFETGIGGWSGVGSTVTQSSAFAHTGTHCAQTVVVGTPGSASLVPATGWPAVVGNSYTATAWVYGTVSVPNIRILISFYTSGAVFVGSFAGSTITLAPGAWTQLTVSGVAPATTGLVKPAVQLNPSPATGTTFYTDDLDVTLDSASAGAGPYVQNAWVVRDPVVTGALKAGSEIHVADPLWWSL